MYSHCFDCFSLGSNMLFINQCIQVTEVLAAVLASLFKLEISYTRHTHGDVKSDIGQQKR